MARFYENLWRKGQPPAEALREANSTCCAGRQRGLVPLEKGRTGCRRTTGPRSS